MYHIKNNYLLFSFPFGNLKCSSACSNYKHYAQLLTKLTGTFYSLSIVKQGVVIIFYFELKLQEVLWMRKTETFTTYKH